MAWTSKFPRPRLSLVLLLGIATAVYAESRLKSNLNLSLSDLSPEQIENGIQDCHFVQALNEVKTKSAPESASLTTRMFAVLFPSSSPAINALLATAYISGPPNFLLALCPPNIDPSSLTIMVAFAVGGLLGDTLFHLLPEIFLGEDKPDKVSFVMLEPNRNLLLGVAILVGIVTFMAMDKILRIATGGAGHSHDHDTKDHSNGSAVSTATPSKKQKEKDLRKRKNSPAPSSQPPTITPSQNPSVKLAGLLNLIADFTHNITDGLALSSSFYASPALGATTTMAVFFHEIPHEVGDFALLIQSGFSKRKAMGAQFITAIGAFLGTCIGIFVQEFGRRPGQGEDMPIGRNGIWGTSLQWGDMLLPFTAGTFLYVGTVAVIPELLETGSNKSEEIRKTLLQFGAMFIGAAIMLGISWS
ncbi:uncharacterized protein HMPREF1541_07611 [Cyphellophora europaea CBS 101466]|uniref:Major histocompatibility complex, class I n=1 Tax=Cyphellophora europaea (strain CBS 101466) TaxID=1220924 RepID=W2RQK6_CYPE1|nr:uncharacterized protein HMPREF1541_07611 [Cyphellophora europaea CBS 101466]ETN37988.1 hypothetical protein HMPREF1541_07611 [Cyphellophora europaea CBS 101466]